ncbi:nudix hydrolase-like protein 10 [Perilla frutescens var. hirtella]|uniref:Nudix hydrolase-like protein 10 n=1 Tax=Perilla frutescens var. hirtella TaxID=608512 RepID=A0AAD4P147_PERFH|nr:nudix hydrolase-like protein 10 [Perilla frutescens var. hirtella]
MLVSAVKIEVASQIQGSCSLMDLAKFENGAKGGQVLPSYEDEHGGVIVEMKEAMDPNDFALILRCSLSQWKLQGKKGVWIKLPIKLVNLAETAVKEGFLYHHAEPHYLMLVNWIPDTPNTIPANATHRLRIGAIVLNEKRELLVVLEKHGKFKGTGIWKIPTGIVDEGEDIFSGATREVKEETGVDTEFIDVLAFRQMHKTFFEKSDLFFLCMMRPLSFDIQIQDSEIDGAQWMPIDEYAAQPFAQQHSFFKYAADICLAKVEKGYTGFTPRPTTFFNDQISYLYVNEALNL